MLVSLVVIALADRLGRRKLILFSLAGACVANLVAGLAPSFEVFTGAQLFTRAFVNACLVVAGIAAVEEAPEGARAFATAMFALALGVGIALGVIFLPFADLGNYGWRISFIVSAGALFFLPFVGRQLRETRRYTTLVGAVGPARPTPRGVRVIVSRAVHAARSGGIHHERLHRAVVTAHQPLPHPRRTTSRTPMSRASAP